VAVSSLDGAGPHERGVVVRAPESSGVSGASGVLEVNVPNAGKRAAMYPARLSPAATSTGCRSK
jgi:hypothetical protein